MAGRGPAPSEGTVKPNQGKFQVHKVPAEGNSSPFPALEGPHAEGTVAWYETWARSPQATKFTITDWQRLQQLAFVVDELYEPTYTERGARTASPVAVMAEIRQNEKLLGATLLDRSSLYMTIEPPKDPQAAEKATPPSERTAQRRQQMRIAG